MTDEGRAGVSDKVVATRLGAVEHGEWLRFALGFLAVVVFGGLGIGFLACLQLSRDQPMQGTVFGLISLAFFAFAVSTIREIRKVTR